MNDSEKLKLCLEALRTIKRAWGQVCEEFEICSHAACQSSVACWMLASETLEKIGEDDTQ